MTKSVAEGWERHAQTIVSAVIVVMLAWVGTSLMSLQEDTAVAAVELQHVKADLAAINTRLAEAYPLSQALRDREDIKTLQERVTKLEIKRYAGTTETNP